MTDYKVIELDFIRRTIAILDQYDSHVRGNVSPGEEYEVTLLLNCLLGLLIYPHHLATEKKWGSWLTNDKVKDAGPEWGINLDNIKCAGHKIDNKAAKKLQPCIACNRKPELPYVTIDKDNLTIRQLVRQLRNAVAHPSFRTEPDGNGTDQIHAVEFKDKDPRTKNGERFHVFIPVETLNRFVRKLAEAALQEQT
ncbi:MAG: HEPN family nuclease [Caldilineaceae bacterium]